MKGKLLYCIMAIMLIIAPERSVMAADAVLDVKAKSSILIEQSTGKVLFENNADERLAPASVTKVMTMLLIMEAIDEGKISLTDMVSCSDYAASMGGSQVFLEVGETMSCEDMLKAIAVASGNDAAVAMAEYVGGSNENFVAMMNERAKQLGMENTNFVNPTGLDDDNHYTSARDIAIMSRELLKHEKILDYTRIWMDSLRGGKFTLSNTNKLIRFYDGATGLKTGSTGKAMYCLSASATRNDLDLIAVVLAAPTPTDRFEGAKKLLSYGFSGYESAPCCSSGEEKGEVYVRGGTDSVVKAVTKDECKLIVPKGKSAEITETVIVEEEIMAPVEEGQKIGRAEYMLGSDKIGEVELVALKSVPKLTFISSLGKLLSLYVGKP